MVQDCGLLVQRPVTLFPGHIFVVLQYSQAAQSLFELHLLPGVAKDGEATSKIENVTPTILSNVVFNLCIVCCICVVSGYPLLQSGEKNLLQRLVEEKTAALQEKRRP